MNITNRRARFYGRVQGINFRRSVFEKALELDVRGWVTNLSDGSVEAVFSGDEPSVNSIINFCLREIPLARIERYTVEKAVEEEFDTFRIL